MDDFTDLKTSLKSFESCVSFMYLDTTGNVTVGVGHMIGSCADAQALAFILRQGGAAATAAQIASDYNSVAAQQKGMLYTHYQQFTSLDMAANAMDALLDADIAHVVANIKRWFPAFDGFPNPAKNALLDMAFNLGLPGLPLKFPHLTVAANRGDWNTCANECQRIGIQDSRNDWTKQQFEQAANLSVNVPV